MGDVRHELARIEPPCKDCVLPIRYSGCHSVCQKYVQWRAARDDLLKQKQKNLNTNDAYIDIRYSHVNKARKHKNLPK